MVALLANTMMANMRVAAGATVKREIECSPEQAKSASQTESGIQVSFSLAARRVATILNQKVDIASVTSTSDFSAFIDGMHAQLSSDGRGAAAIAELPADVDPARANLAKQAANYLLKYYYAEDKAYDDVSAKNPFASFDRKQLSRMAFDDSGDFTPAERQLAFLEITDRDIQYRNQTYDLQEDLNKDRPGLWSILTSYSRDARLSAAMSDAEREWRGWNTAAELKSVAVSFTRRSGIELPDLPEYGDLASASPVITVPAVQRDDTSDVTADDVRLGLIDALEQQTTPDGSDEPETEKWLSIYSVIEGYAE